tara:strand:- start:1112 stop:1510 length:399 start_codon:yes stop_codon:yes gene_type:complete
MITAEVYSDIQIVQGADFSRDIEFSYSDTNSHKWYGGIAKDRKGTQFNHLNNSGQAALVSFVPFTIVRKDENEITIKLTATQTRAFDDDFEGVWDLYSQPDANTASRVREVQGDVVVSPSVSDSSTSFTSFD